MSLRCAVHPDLIIPLDPLQNTFIDKILDALVDDTVNKLCSKLTYIGTLQLLSANSLRKLTTSAFSRLCSKHILSIFGS